MDKVCPVPALLPRNGKRVPESGPIVERTSSDTVRLSSLAGNQRRRLTSIMTARLMGATSECGGVPLYQRSCRYSYSTLTRNGKCRQY